MVINPFFLLCVDGWESRWVKSDWKKSEDAAGDWVHTAGKWHGDSNDKGSIHSLSCSELYFLSTEKL